MLSTKLQQPTKHVHMLLAVTHNTKSKNIWILQGDFQYYQDLETDTYSSDMKKKETPPLQHH